MSSSTSVPVRVHLVLLAVQVSFGSWQVIGKYALRYFPPLVLANLRALLAVPLLFLVARVGGSVRVERRDLPRLFILGLLGVVLNQVLFVTGIQYTTATNSGILMPSIPVFTVAISALFGLERLGWRRLLGVGVAVAGVLIMLDPSGFDVGGQRLFGNVLILGNCLAYAVFVVLQRPILTRHRSITVTAWAFLFGALTLLPVTWRSLATFSYVDVPTWGWGVLLYIVLVPTCLTYAMVAWALSRSSPSLVATYTTLQPVTAALVAALVLGEDLHVAEGIGFIFIVAGLLIVSRSTRAPSHA